MSNYSCFPMVTNFVYKKCIKYQNETMVTKINKSRCHETQYHKKGCYKIQTRRNVSRDSKIIIENSKNAFVTL